MKKERIRTDRGPGAIGPYSQAIVAGEMVFVSGQIPIDPATGKLIEGDVGAQTDRVMRNLEAILTASGSGIDRVIKTTVYLADMNDFEAMNRVYGRYVGEETPPARATVQAAGLPKGARIEIDAIALR